MSEGGPLRIAQERLELALGLRVTAQPVIRYSQVIAQTRSVHARAPRIEERLKRRPVISSAKRLYTLIESLRALGGGARRPRRNDAKEQRNDDDKAGNPKLYVLSTCVLRRRIGAHSRRSLLRRGADRLGRPGYGKSGFARNAVLSPLARRLTLQVASRAGGLAA